MFQRIRRSLAMAVLSTALCLALSAPSQAVGLWDPPASAGLAMRVWSWLEGLGLTARAPAAPERRATLRGQKSGGTIDPDDTTTEPPDTPDTDQGSGIDPNGGR